MGARGGACSEEAELVRCSAPRCRAGERLRGQGVSHATGTSPLWPRICGQEPLQPSLPLPRANAEWPDRCEGESEGVGRLASPGPARPRAPPAITRFSTARAACVHTQPTSGPLPASVGGRSADWEPPSPRLGRNPSGGGDGTLPHDLLWRSVPALHTFSFTCRLFVFWLPLPSRFPRLPVGEELRRRNWKSAQ